MKFQCFAGVLLIFLGFVSCEKEIEVDYHYKTRTDSLNGWMSSENLGETIIAGWPKNMVVHEIDQKVHNKFDTVILDPDSNGVADIEIFSQLVYPEVYGNPVYYRSRINTLQPDAYIAFTTIPDSIYVYIDSVFSSITGAFYRLEITENCTNTGPYQNVFTEFKSPASFEPNDIIRSGMNFLSDTCDLLERTGFQEGEPSEDLRIYIRDCVPLPFNSIRYIGFRLGSGEESRFGWIKLILEKNSQNSISINVLSYAIQKK